MYVPRSAKSPILNLILIVARVQLNSRWIAVHEKVPFLDSQLPKKSELADEKKKLLYLDLLSWPR